MATYNTSDLRKGLKVQIEGVPFLILECLFVKPGKGQALYKMKLQNILRGTTIERTLKSGDSIEAADVHDQDMRQSTQRRASQTHRWERSTAQSYSIAFHGRGGAFFADLPYRFFTCIRADSLLLRPHTH